MPFREEEATTALLLQKERGKSFAMQAAERIQLAQHCLFSLLPHEELARIAEDWYEACSQAMLRGNYSPIDMWIRAQSRLAATQGFTPEDVLQLLHACRSSALETECWNEDIFSAVDEVMQEVLTSIYGKLPLKMAATPKASHGDMSKAEPRDSSADIVNWSNDRRRFVRNRLRFPIRLRKPTPNDETPGFTFSESVSRGGLYFQAHEKYEIGQILKITFPYWNAHDSINSEYTAKVIRLDELPDRIWGVGVDFVESLGRKGR